MTIFSFVLISESFPFFTFSFFILFLLLIPVLIRIIFEFYWVSTRKRYKFDNDDGKAWAVITGSGSGLGLEYAKLIAGKGFNLLLLSLLPGELLEAEKTIAEFLEDNELPAVKVKTLAVDFSKTETCYPEIEDFLSPYKSEVKILLNNVGTDGQHSDYFDLEPGTRRRNRLMIDVNIYSMTRMIEILLPQLKSTGNGLIISISSGAARTASPLLATYSSTKAYIRTMMTALAIENRKYGMTFVTFCPYWISTNLTNNAPTNYFMPKPEVYARASLSRIRYQGFLETIGYFPHQVLYGTTKLVGLLGGKPLEDRYLHRMMAEIRDFRRKLVKKE